MRILHTADWHLGARLGVHERLPDQREAIDSLVACAHESQPDLVIHSGDLFDTFNPGHEVLHTALRAMYTLAEIAPTIIIGGNHDSYALLRALETLTRHTVHERLRLVTEPKSVTVRTENAGTAHVACMPFLSAGRALQGRNVHPEERRQAYAERVAALSEQVWTELESSAGVSDARLYAAHLYVAGSRPGRSERRVTISEDYATDGRRVPDAEYGAFGHIHDAQLIPGRERSARYAGALVPLDFGESEQRKLTWIVELAGGPAPTTCTAVHHRTGRALLDFDGEADELLAAAARGELDDRIVRAIVRSDERIYDLSQQLTAAAPDAVIHELTNVVRNQEAVAVDDYDYRPVSEPPLEELYVEWRKTRTRRERENDDVAAELFAQALKNSSAPGSSDYGADKLEERTNEAIETLQGQREAATIPA